MKYSKMNVSLVHSYMLLLLTYHLLCGAVMGDIVTTPHQCSISRRFHELRGGGSAEDNEVLDNLVNKLIEGVSDDYVSDEIDSDIDENKSTDDEREHISQQKDKLINEKGYERKDKSIENKERIDILDINSTKAIKMNKIAKNNGRIKPPQGKNIKKTLTSKRKTKKSKKMSTKQKINENISNTTIKNETKELNETNTPMSTPRRPNAIYRYLLKRGYIGHVIIIQSLILSNILKQYTPPLYSTLLSITIKLRIYNPYEVLLPINKRKITNNRKIQEELDKIALQKLQSIQLQSKAKESMQRVKYKYLNLDFMKRHSIGSFATQSSNNDKKEDDAKDIDTQDSDEEDDHWVELALQPKENMLKQTKSLKPKPTKKKSNNILNSFTDTFSDYYTKKRVLGTYPNDAVPIEDAANRDGVFALAQRYGYGTSETDETSIDKKSSFDFLSKMKDKAMKNISFQTSSSSKIGLNVSYSTCTKRSSDTKRPSIFLDDDIPRTFGSHLSKNYSKRKSIGKKKVRKAVTERVDDDNESIPHTFGSHLKKYE